MAFLCHDSPAHGALRVVSLTRQQIVMPPPKRPTEEIHEEWVAVLKHLVDRLRAKRVTVCLPFLPGKGRAQVQPVFEPEKGADGFGETLKNELYELINGIRTAQEGTINLLDGPDGVLGVIDKLVKVGCPIGDATAFLVLAKRFDVPVPEQGRDLRRVEGGRLDPEAPAQQSTAASALPLQPHAPPAATAATHAPAVVTAATHATPQQRKLGYWATDGRRMSDAIWDGHAQHEVKDQVGVFAWNGRVFGNDRLVALLSHATDLAGCRGLGPTARAALCAAWLQDADTAAEFDALPQAERERLHAVSCSREPIADENSLRNAREWYCDVGGPGCIRPCAGVYPESDPMWVCGVEDHYDCDSAMCDVCHATDATCPCGCHASQCARSMMLPSRGEWVGSIAYPS